jgi:putative heme-binding domain-containing protein
MFGALYVVADLEDYLADPESYLARNPLPLADPLLKYNRPRTQWKFDDLIAAVETMESGRSFVHGKLMFQVANCVACHKMDGTGTEFGPDLTKLDPRLKPADILRDIVEPSFKINDKYYSHTIELQSGKLVTGLVLEETATEVKLIENPLTKVEPLSIRTADIAERKKSNTSIMPGGLLDKLAREEILDLMAFVIARGDPKHRLFQGEHASGHGHHSKR